MTQNQYAIDQLQTTNLCHENVGRIKELIKLLQLPVVNSKAAAGFIVSRARRGKGYRCKEDMNYKPAEICKSAQRASLPYQTVFYGVVSDNEKHLENARAICVSECSKLALAGKKSVGREYIANSQWLICEDINIVCITAELSYDGVTNNKLLKLIKENFVTTFRNNKEALMLAEFIEGEFSKRVPDGNDNQYLISAAIADILLFTYSFEAVAYPSVKLGGQAGLNIAIRPDVADKKLQLISIADQCYYKNGEEGMVRIESIYDVANDKFIPTHQCTDEQLCKQIGIGSIEELEVVE